MKKLLYSIFAIFLFCPVVEARLGPKIHGLDRTGVENISVDMTASECGDGQVAKWNDGNSEWECADDSSGSGTAPVDDFGIDVTAGLGVSFDGGRVTQDVTWSDSSLTQLRFLFRVKAPVEHLAPYMIFNGSTTAFGGTGGIAISGDSIRFAQNDSGELLINNGSSFVSVAMGGDGTIDSSGSLSVTDVGNNSVALGTDTTGNYVADLAATTLETTVSGGGSENATVTVGVPDQFYTTDVSGDTVSADTYYSEGTVLDCDDAEVLGGKADGTGIECQTDAGGSGTSPLEDFMTDVSAGFGVSVDTTGASHDLSWSDGSLGDISFIFDLSGTDVKMKVDSGRIGFSGDLAVSGDDLFWGTNTDGHILVNDGTSFNNVDASGDVEINNSGATTIQSGAVEDTMMANEDFGDFTCDSSEDGCTVNANAVALTTDTTGNYAAGDAEAGAATNIQDGLIVEADLDADVAPTDEDFLQYDSTGANFTWRSDTEVLSDLSSAANDWDANGDVTITGADISDQNAGTDITADLEEESHCSEHNSADVDCSGETIIFAADAVSNDEIATQAVSTDQLEAINKPTNAQLYSYNSTALKGEWVTAAGTGTVNAVQEDDAQVGDADIAVLNFGAMLDATESPDTQINVSVDINELTEVAPVSGDFVALMDASDSNAIKKANWGEAWKDTKCMTLIEPDQIQTVSADVHMFHVNSNEYPQGIEITQFYMRLNASLDSNYVFESWNDSSGTIQHTLSKLTTSTTDAAASEQPDTDGTVSADYTVVVSIDTVNVNQSHVCFDYDVIAP